MQDHLGEALSGFDSALKRLRAQLGVAPALEVALFAGADDWLDLLSFKLLPHFAGEGCLVAAVAGGTNTGKSTAFNLLLGRDISPVRNTAAATSRPVLAGNAHRYRQCLDGQLMPEFSPQPLVDAEAVVRSSSAPGTLYAVEEPGLPDRLVLLDTPDVDSIDQQNWEVAEHIRAAGDVLIAVLTGEKYKDDRVVQFFRQARAAGRMILPLMNKANPEHRYQIARDQLAEFAKDVGIEAPPCFVLPHDFSLARDFGNHAIESLDSGPPLREFLEQLDVPQIKTRVYRDTVSRFCDRAGEFVLKASTEAQQLRGILDTFNALAHDSAGQYAPLPGEAVGGLFHQYVQSKRGPFEKMLGAASRGVARSVTAVGRGVARAWTARSTFEAPSDSRTEQALKARHNAELQELTDRLAQRYFEVARSLRPPLDALVLEQLEALDLKAVARQVVRQTVQAETISEAFRAHAQKQLDAWWQEHPGQRRMIMAIDSILMVTPAAIAGFVAIHTAGIGSPEVLAGVLPLVEQFASKYIEYQWGDQLFDLISPWQREQQAALEQALVEHLASPALQRLKSFSDPLESSLDELEKWRNQCLNLISTS